MTRQLTENLARGGNYLLNVGPDAAGRIPETSAGILHRLCAWYRRCSPALCAEPLGRWKELAASLTLSPEGKLFLILDEIPASSTLELSLWSVRQARLLNTGAELEVTDLPVVYHRGKPVTLLRWTPEVETHAML